jgi:DNA-binding response OmpR family regulator
MSAPAANVLVVEDDPDTREMLETFLSLEGFEAVGAEDGLEALHLLRSVQRRAPQVPCLILLDLSMPRLSGTEFRRAQLNDPKLAGVPVAIISGAADLEQSARELGAVAAVTKPIDFTKLLEIIRRHCRPSDSGTPAGRLTQGRSENGA